jgi:hypothetical protein
VTRQAGAQRRRNPQITREARRRPSGSLFQARGNELGSIPGQYLGLIGLLGTLNQLDLLSAPFFGSRAELRRNGVRIDKLLSKAGTGPRSKSQYHTEVEGKSNR